VSEKIALYAVIIKYIRFDPRPSSDLESAVIHPETNLDSTSLLRTSASTIRVEQVWGFDGSCLISSSAEIMEDMALSVAELVAVEYLSTIQNTHRNRPKAEARSFRWWIRSGTVASCFAEGIA